MHPTASSSNSSSLSSSAQNEGQIPCRSIDWSCINAWAKPLVAPSVRPNDASAVWLAGFPCYARGLAHQIEPWPLLGMRKLLVAGTPKPGIRWERGHSAGVICCAGVLKNDSTPHQPSTDNSLRTDDHHQAPAHKVCAKSVRIPPCKHWVSDSGVGLGSAKIKFSGRGAGSGPVARSTPAVPDRLCIIPNSAFSKLHRFTVVHSPPLAQSCICQTTHLELTNLV
ncbi:hypothetical protein MYU51_005275 [Penicillium brevicompactum]